MPIARFHFTFLFTGTANVGTEAFTSTIVASCSVCNQIKSWLMFKDIYECQAYIMRQWRYKGFTTERPTMLVSDLRQAVP